jgi:hypothetical protein
MQPVHAREWRLVSRLTAMALHALDQCGLLAEDVSPRRGEDIHLQGASAAQHVGSHQALSPQRVDLATEYLFLGTVLVPDEHPGLFRADTEHADQESLKHQVRLIGEDLPVLEGAGL